jgi:hypothetical protein
MFLKGSHNEKQKCICDFDIPLCTYGQELGMHIYLPKGAGRRKLGEMREEEVRETDSKR